MNDVWYREVYGGGGRDGWANMSSNRERENSNLQQLFQESFMNAGCVLALFTIMYVHILQDEFELLNREQREVQSQISVPVDPYYFLIK